MWLRLIEKVLRRLLRKYFLVLPRDSHGILHDGVLTSVDLADHQIVDKTRYLIVEKGKYAFVPRPYWIRRHTVDTSVQAIIDNSVKAFDDFWTDNRCVAEYLVEARKDFYREVLNNCQMYLHGRVVDVGCGPGFVAQALSSSGLVREIYGFDFSAASIKRCREEVPGGHFFVGDVYRASCRNESFDVVICMETLEHLEEPDMAIRELFRLCRDGGHVIITVPNGASDQYVGHINFWTEEAFRALLPGLGAVKFWYCQEGKTMLFLVENRGVRRETCSV